jgi:hypothetical protein
LSQVHVDQTTGASLRRALEQIGGRTDWADPCVRCSWLMRADATNSLRRLQEIFARGESGGSGCLAVAFFVGWRTSADAHHASDLANQPRGDLRRPSSFFRIVEVDRMRRNACKWYMLRIGQHRRLVGHVYTVARSNIKCRIRNGAFVAVLR